MMNYFVARQCKEFPYFLFRMLSSSNQILGPTNFIATYIHIPKMKRYLIDTTLSIPMFKVCIQKKTVCTYAHIKKYLHIREYETVQQKKLFDSIHFIFDISCIKIYMYDNRYSKLYK